MSKAMFFTGMLTVLVCANLYIFWRLWHMVPQGNPMRWVVLAFGVVAVSSLFVGRMFEDSLPQVVAAFLQRFGTSWFFYSIYFLMFFIVVDILRLCGVPLGQYMFGSWTGFLVSVGVVVVVMVAGNIRYYCKKRVELNLAVDKPLPSGGVKIVAISDLHLGYSIGRRELVKWVELINAEQPDVVLIAGDVTDKRARRLFDDGLASEFRGIESKYGVYAALGNHEYINDVGESIAFMREAGITVLRDSVATVGGLFHVVGRDDRHNRRRLPLDALVDGLDRGLPVIVLDHQPYDLEQAPRNGVDLQISGHTHRGQIWPISWAVDRMYELSHGYLDKDGSHVYVSSGLGIWGGKYRIGTRSEYVVIKLEGK